MNIFRRIAKISRAKTRLKMFEFSFLGLKYMLGCNVDWAHKDKATNQASASTAPASPASGEPASAAADDDGSPDGVGRRTAGALSDGETENDSADT